MSDLFVPKDRVKWVNIKILGKYELLLPEHLARWDVWEYWEKERMASMQNSIKRGDVLYDVGAEEGWMSALFSKYITPNLIMVEPTSEFWPNIKETFKHNDLEPPNGSVVGFLGNSKGGKATVVPGFPTEADGAELIEKRKYRYLHDPADLALVPQMTLDELVRLSLPPGAITIDVEGAELLVLRGAEKTLREVGPMVWVSIHPDLCERDYNTTEQEIHDYMEGLGYKGEHLAYDHEHHYRFTKRV